MTANDRRDLAPAHVLDAEGRAECIRLLFEVSPQGYLASLAVAVLAVVSLWGEVSPEGLFVWLYFVVAVTIGRYALFKVWERRAPPAGDAIRWERGFSVGAGLMGCAWGALVVWLFPLHSFPHQLMVTFIAAFMAMGGMGTLTPSWLAFLAFVTPIALTVIPRIFLLGGPTFIALGVLGLVYVALIFKMYTTFHGVLVSTIRLRGEQNELIERLRHAEHRLTDAVESVPEAIALYDASDRLVLCNREYVRAQTPFDEPAEVIGRSFSELVRLAVAKGEPIEPQFAGDLEAWIAERIRRRAQDQSGVARLYQIADGRWMQAKVNRTRDGGLIAVRTDITRQREIEESLKEALRLGELILETATVGIVFLRDRRVVKCNREFERMFGYPAGGLIGHSSAIWFPTVEAWERVGDVVYAAIGQGQTVETEQQFVRKDGTRVWCHAAGRAIDAADPSKGAIWVYSDITERKRKDAEVRALAHHDALTGLPNRRLLDDRLGQAIALCRRNTSKLAVMLLDLDRFKPINDRLGHDAGDQVLKTVATRLQGCVRAADTTARLGGDEFVIVLPSLRVPDDAERIAEAILQALSCPISVAGTEATVGASIGISVFPDDGDLPERLLQCADRAMYNTKASGRNGFRFYSRAPSEPPSAP